MFNIKMTKDGKECYVPVDTSTTAANVFVERAADDGILLHYRVGDLEIKVAGKENREKFLRALAVFILLQDELDPEGTKEQMRKAGIEYTRVAPQTCKENTP